MPFSIPREQLDTLGFFAVLQESQAESGREECLRVRRGELKVCVCDHMLQSISVNVYVW